MNADFPSDFSKRVLRSAMIRRVSMFTSRASFYFTSWSFLNVAAVFDNDIDIDNQQLNVEQIVL